MNPLAVQLPLQVIAEVPVLDLLVKVVDHLREDNGYTHEVRASALAHAESLIKAIKTRTGNQQVVGRGNIGG